VAFHFVHEAGFFKRLGSSLVGVCPKQGHQGFDAAFFGLIHLIVTPLVFDNSKGSP
jgi:hypothetical protein